ncbi:LpqB family beta-propeller domain-containing protein [Hippea maritima]|uniref:WD40-like beta Propeller containing protein n=1 Tax=Hippea maritima (strain ATCC 700847 / DSM 10411 / MH2) TaxID=760142 RepID=F2LW21_HIPMA|nr:LpqB family beta-propeller domain-containing protein [Hippea maritima]AEA33955.1 WD40-like beta Propeller containing protein [Hippea maritima DSM 10411]
MKRFVVFLAFIVFIGLNAQADTFKIEISNPKYKPINIGLWGFVKNTPTSISKRFLSTLKRDLKVSGLFSWDETQHFSYDAPSKVVNGIAKLDNLDYVIYGDAYIEGKSIYVNVRITDVLKNSVLFEKTYTTNEYSLGWLANRVVDVLIGYVTGVYGPFESKIAFALGDGRVSDIYVCDFNGENVVRITNWHNFNILPKWVSDDELTFLSYRYGKPALFLFNVFSGKLSKLFSNSNLSISASRYMGYFAIPFNRFGSVNIYAVNARGRVIKKLTNDPSINVSPTFTPDFSKMVFVSNRGGNPQIYIKDLSSFDSPVRLTFNGKYNSSPAVSPDGKKIAYISIDNGTTYLKVMNIDGSNDRVVMKGNSLDSPSWAYDSRFVALTGRVGNKNAIFVVNTINGNYSVAMESKLIYNGLSVSSKLQ